LEDLKQLYIDEIEYIDEQVGVLEERLKERGLRENTALLITADHGEEFLEHGHLHHQRYIYEELTHVPLIITGKENEEIIESITSLIDLGPTILEIADIEPSGRFIKGTPLHKEKTDKAFMQAAEGDVLSGTNPSPFLTGEKKFGLRYQNWHYLHNTTAQDELYELTQDREEQHNVLEGRSIPNELQSIMENHVQQFVNESILKGIDV